MPVPSPIAYPLSSTSTGAVNVGSLHNEIVTSTITVALDSVTFEAASSEISISFKADIGDAEKLILDGIIAAHSAPAPLGSPRAADGSPIVTTSTPKTSIGADRVQVDIREGSKLEIVSQNFCDRRTWFTQSIRKTGVILVDSGDGLTWNLPGGPKAGVDLAHGRVSGEDELAATYHPVVYVDSVAKVEHSADSTFTYSGGAEVHAFAGGDGDFGVDYSTMAVTFKTSQAGRIVTLDYSEVAGSRWYLTPEAGKRVLLEAAELQFSRDARMRSAFVFQARGDVAKHPALAALWDANGGPYPAGTMISLGPPSKYKTKMDLINEANIAHPVIPADTPEPMSWRDLPQDVQIYRWDYGQQAAVLLSSAWGMDVEISLEGDIEAGGLAAVVTFYGVSEAEPG